MVRTHKITLDEANEYFTECKRWLWAMAKLKEARESGKENLPQGLSIHPEIAPIDLAWHGFVNHTQAYAEFCHHYLGRFIHLQPITQAEYEERNRLAKLDPEKLLKIRQEELKPELSYLYDLLGPEVVALWFKEYPKRPHH